MAYALFDDQQEISGSPHGESIATPIKIEYKKPQMPDPVPTPPVPTPQPQTPMSNPDPVSAAMNQDYQNSGSTFFPAVNQMMSQKDDLLKDTEDTFYGGQGGQQPGPTPSPSPTPAPKSGPTPPHQLNLQDLYQQFGVQPPAATQFLGNMPISSSAKGVQDWTKDYGWGYG